MKNNLQEALDFTNEDLQANRDGYMTKRQRKKLNRHRRDVRIVQYTVGFIVFLMSFACIASTGVVLIPCLALYVAAILFASWRDFRDANRDLYKGLVVSITAEIKLAKKVNNPPLEAVAFNNCT